MPSEEDYSEELEMEQQHPDKRAWNSGFAGGMGKRAWNSGTFNIPLFKIQFFN